MFPSFKQISIMLPLSFILDFCESWSLAEAEEQSSKNPCSHHKATSVWSVHCLCNCWVSCVRSADAAKWKAMDKSFFFFFFFRTPNMSGLLGEGKGSKSKITHCHLIWQLECRFNVWGQLHLSAKRHSFSSTIRMLLLIDVKVLLEQLIGLNVSMLLCTWIGFLWGTKDQSECFCLKGSYDVETFIWVLCLIYNRSEFLHLGRRQGKKQCF